MTPKQVKAMVFDLVVMARAEPTEARRQAKLKLAMEFSRLADVKPRRGAPTKAPDIALLERVHARVAAGAAEYEAARLALGLKAPAGAYPPQVKPLVEQYRAWRKRVASSEAQMAKLAAIVRQHDGK